MTAPLRCWPGCTAVIVNDSGLEWECACGRSGKFPGILGAIVRCMRLNERGHWDLVDELPINVQCRCKRTGAGFITALDDSLLRPLPPESDVAEHDRPSELAEEW